MGFCAKIFSTIFQIDNFKIASNIMRLHCAMMSESFLDYLKKCSSSPHEIRW